MEIRPECVCDCWCGRSSRVIQADAGNILISVKNAEAVARFAPCSDKRYAQRRESLELDGK